jgi:hypothetical protein
MTKTLIVTLALIAICFGLAAFDSRQEARDYCFLKSMKIDADMCSSSQR